ncbi:hypothetical protein LZU85_02770 [Vibrio sp. IRLE0018]|uniref:hypothetical protein n=1 Tax=Vibrio floridensis TaxID=2908007 RepID=UPI001A335370|nr:hypothetical protein [Vibrio floridensis]MCF8777712.1 hypothetical protein [Vibrio floridensis]HAS6346862.1 hypothetical protein [Vibrio vulnificus]
MKRFLPSSVMLTPFVVRYYDENESDQNDSNDSTLDEGVSIAENGSGCKTANTELE